MFSHHAHGWQTSDAVDVKRADVSQCARNVQTDEERVRVRGVLKVSEVGLQTLGPHLVESQATNKPRCIYYFHNTDYDFRQNHFDFLREILQKLRILV